MDYDDNDIQDQNLILAGEGSSKVSPVLHSYPLPKFDFGENLQEHLGFDSLVENEVFLGITSQEDNQWIEEYSSAPESRHQNVWSEATSSESVEMLLKSVGQEEKVLEETMVEGMDPNIKQCDENDANEIADCEQSHVTFTSQSQETQILDSVVVGDEYGKSFGEKKVDKVCDDANEEGSNLEKESFVNELQENPSVSIIESGNASVVECQENTQEVLETLDKNASDLTKNYEHLDKINDDAIDEGSNMESQSFDNKLQEDLSVSNVESGNEGSLQNVDTSVEEKPQEVVETHDENASYISETFHGDEHEHNDKICDDANQECSNLGNELQEDVSVSNIEHENAGSSQNVDASDLSKKFDSSEPEIIDKICDDENQEGRNLANESNVNEVQEDPSVFKGEFENTESLHNVDESIENCQENENAGDVLKNSDSGEYEHVEKIHDDANEEDSNLVKESFVNELQETQPLDPDAESMDQDSTIDERGNSRLPLDFKDMDMVVVGVPDGEKNVESENNAPDIDTVDSSQSTPVKISGLGQVDDEHQSSEPDVVLMDQDSTFSERGDSRLHLDSKDMEMDVDKAPESQKNVEPSSSIVIAQGYEPSMAVTTDAVAVVESSKTSSHETPQAGVVNEDQPRSPILGVSLLHDDNKEKVEVEESCKKETPQVDTTLQEVKKDAVSDSVQKDAGDCDLSIVNCNVSPSDQTTSDSSKEVNNAKIGDLLDLKESMAKEDGVEGEGGSASLDKPQVFSFSDTKSINLEPSQSEKDKVNKGTIENTPVLKITNEETGLQPVSSSAKKEEKSFTFEVTEQTGIQNLDLSKVSTVSSSGIVLDMNIPRENSLVTPQKPSVTPSESGAKKKSERKPRRKSVGKETAKKVNNNSKETTPTRLSNSRTEKSPPFITAPDLNNPTLFHHSFTDNQQVQLRAQILVYGSLISGTSPEEPHMIAAFGQSDSGRKAWESAWNACKERVHFQKSQINNNPNTPLQSRPINKDPNQETKINSTKNKFPSTPTTTNPVVSPMFPNSSPLWNMSTPQNQLQSNQTPRNPLFDYRQNLSPLHSFQSQRPNPYGQWVASSPVPAFSPRFSSLPITESVKLTTVKESGGPATSITPLQHTTTPIVLSGQPLTESKTRKRKKVADNSMSVITTHSLTPVAFSTPVSITPKTNPFLSALSTPPTHGQAKPVDQNMEKTVTKDDTMSKIEESKVQATEAAVHAANAVTHCQDVWSQLERQKNSGLISDDEAKLASSAVSIAAASSVAKVAAFAAKIASNVAEQARLMADEVISSTKTVAPLKSDNSSSVISVAREAARRRIEAALTASKHAENLDAIVKAAELAAEAVSQAGKIVAVGNPLTIKELVEAGPDGYWRTSQAAKNIQGYSGNKEKVGAGSSDKKTDSGNGKSVERVCEGLDLSKTIGAVPELVIGQMHTSGADVDMPQSTSHSWKDNDIKEGCLVEVYKDDNKNKGAWFAANVLTLKDGKAYVCYTEIQSNEGSGNLKEWVPLEVEGSGAPKIRIAHPMTTLRFEGNKKRGRTVFSDYSWCSGDQVDVWVHDSWQEAVVVETNKIDLTSLTVQFPAQGKTSVVRSWHVRPSLVWKDGKWIEWSSLKPSHSSQGDTPQEKRQKFDKEKEKSIDLETMKHQESRIPLPTFSTQNISFDIGKSKTSIDDKKQKTRGPMRSGLHKEKSRVVFGVPQPSKKQKFIDMSKHYVADHGTNKNNNNNNPPSNLAKKFFINDEKDKQVAEVKSKAPKFRKPPVPTLSQREKSKSSVSDKNVKDSVRVDEKLPRQQKEMGSGSLSHDVALNTPKKGSTSKLASERLNNKRKIPSGNGKASKVEVKDSLTSEAEPRRSNRKIQPTSRLLEGLQSQLSISKMPTVSHSTQRSHISKGSPRPG